MSWFRGSADETLLETDCKSIIVYGENGSGKSSFVDAVECGIREGKIGHLAHEYSGRHQEKGIINTHRPEGRDMTLTFTFQNREQLRISVHPDGSYTRTGAHEIAMHKWDYRSTVLRQDEVSGFVHDTKGEKYSALLPLLGLNRLELAAGNLRELSRCIDRESRISEIRHRLSEVDRRRKTTFGTHTEDEIHKQIQVIHSKYCPEGSDEEVDSIVRCDQAANAVTSRIEQLSEEQRVYLALQDASKINR